MKKALALLLILNCTIIFCIPGKLNGDVPIKKIDDYKIQDYELMLFSKGDINNDELEDIIAVYHVNNEMAPENLNRKLKRIVVLFINNDNEYVIDDSNNNLIYYYGYDSNFPESLVDIKIKKGTLKIEMYGGFSKRWGREIIFRYHEETKRIIFNKDTTTYFSATDSDEVLREVVITDKDTGIIDWGNYNIY